MGKRDSIQVKFDILRVARGNSDGVSKTRLVRQANLNFRAIEHLNDLEAKDLLFVFVNGRGRKSYRVTGGGEHLYQVLNELYRIVGTDT